MLCRVTKHVEEDRFQELFGELAGCLALEPQRIRLVQDRRDPSLLVYYRPGDLPAARRLAAALGVGSVAEGNVPIDVVDLTVVVGADFHPTRS